MNLQKFEVKSFRDAGLALFHGLAAELKSNGQDRFRKAMKKIGKETWKDMENDWVNRLNNQKEHSKLNLSVMQYLGRQCDFLLSVFLARLGNGSNNDNNNNNCEKNSNNNVEKNHRRGAVPSPNPPSAP